MDKEQQDLIVLFLKYIYFSYYQRIALSQATYYALQLIPPPTHRIIIQDYLEHIFFSLAFIYFETQCSHSKCSMFSVQMFCSCKEITFKCVISACLLALNWIFFFFLKFACFSQLTDSANGVRLGRGYLFVQPMTDGESVWNVFVN